MGLTTVCTIMPPTAMMQFWPETGAPRRMSARHRFPSGFISSRLRRMNGAPRSRSRQKAQDTA